MSLLRFEVLFCQHCCLSLELWDGFVTNLPLEALPSLLSSLLGTYTITTSLFK